jgi:hypothetical protein
MRRGEREEFLAVAATATSMVEKASSFSSGNHGKAGKQKCLPLLCDLGIAATLA